MLACVLLLPVAAFAAPGTLHLSVERASNDQASAEGIDLWLTGDDAPVLHLQVAQLDIEVLSWQGPLDWKCPLQRTDAGDGAMRWQCGGVLQVGSYGATLQAVLDGEHLQLDFQHEGADARLQLPVPGLLPVQARIRQVPLPWFADTVRESWPAGQLDAGVLEGDLVYDGGQKLRGSYEVKGLALDSDDGQIAAADLNASGSFEITPDKMKLQTTGELRGGEILLGSVHVPLPGTAAHIKLDAHRAGDGWQVGGALQVGSYGATLQAVLQDERLELDFQHEGASARLQLPLPGLLPVQARIRQVPLTWFADTVRESWSTGQLGAGVLEGDLVYDGGPVLRGNYGLKGLGLDSDDGQIAAANLNVSGNFELTPDKMRLQTKGELRGGEILLGSVYVALPGTPVQVSLDVHRAGDGWQVDQLRWRDPGVLELAGNARLDLAAPKWLRTLRVDAIEVDLGRAGPRYADSWLGTVGFDGLQLSGKMRGAASLAAGQPTQVSVDIIEPVTITDAAGRFAVQGLRGGVDWHASAQRPPRELGWQSVHLHRVPIDAAQLRLHSAAGRLRSDAPLVIGILGGQVVLNNLSLGPLAEHSQISTGVALSNIDLAELSRVMGWPPLVGRLGGAIANIDIDGQLVDLQGGLMLDTFDGTINVTALRLERPFGVAPSLHADIDLRALDLAQLTHAFDFGQITGRMDGQVHDLRLLDWQPVAFDTRLRSRGGGRISQHAVDNLSSLGGTGGGGLQGSMLKLFETFGYSAIGIGCRLTDNVCVMDGLEPANGGYTIVKGSGLPRLTIIGHQRQVDWPTLVERLKAASSGQTPIIQ